MDLSSVKLIVTDMDGTLLNSNGDVSARFFELFPQLQAQNIQLVAASGRQYYSIAEKLAPIKDDVFIIAENGGITQKASKELITYLLDHDNIADLVQKIRTLDGAEVVLCGKKCAYIESENSEFISFFQQFYTKYEKVADLTKVEQDDFFKLAVYHPQDAEQFLFPHFKELEGKLQVKISAEKWLDLSSLHTHKGNALQFLQHYLGIKKSETMVFGDYNNDLEMMALADFSFAMANSHPKVKAVAAYDAKSNDEGGVEHIIAYMLSQRDCVCLDK